MIKNSINLQVAGQSLVPRLFPHYPTECTTDIQSGRVAKAGLGFVGKAINGRLSIYRVK